MLPHAQSLGQPLALALPALNESILLGQHPHLARERRDARCERAVLVQLDAEGGEGALQLALERVGLLVRLRSQTDSIHTALGHQASQQNQPTSKASQPAKPASQHIASSQ